MPPRRPPTPSKPSAATPSPRGPPSPSPRKARPSGEAPCNAWSATQSAPYPWFALGPIATTRRACPELAAEQTFLTTLAAMTLAEAQGPVLILSSDEGLEMVFRADP